MHAYTNGHVQDPRARERERERGNPISGITSNMWYMFPISSGRGRVPIRMNAWLHTWSPRCQEEVLEDMNA
jgi:hypothetical protein